MIGIFRDFEFGINSISRIQVIILNMKQVPEQSTPDSDSRLILDSSTNLDLLAAVQSQCKRSWPVFVQKYTRLLERWCEEWQATGEDTEDVIQETLIELFRRINDYKLNPNTTFRAWLRKVAYFRYLRMLNKHRRLTTFTDAPYAIEEDNCKILITSQACDSFMQLIDQMADQELVEMACRRIAGRISKENWAIFCRREREGVPSKTVAEEFGISANAVDVITFRVRKMIRAELEMLDPQKQRFSSG